MQNSPPPDLELQKFLIQKQLIHLKIKFKHEVPGIVRSEAFRGNSDTPVISPY